MAPLEIEIAAGDAERLRFEVIGTDLAGFVGSESEEVPEDEDMENLRWIAENNLVLAGAAAKTEEADEEDDVDSGDVGDEGLCGNGAERRDCAGKGGEEESAEEEEREEDDAEELEEIELLERLYLTVRGVWTCSSVALEVDDFAETTGLLGGMSLTLFPRGDFRGFVEETLPKASSSWQLSSLLSLLLSCLSTFAAALVLVDFEIEVEFFKPLEDSPMICGITIGAPCW